LGASRPSQSGEPLKAGRNRGRLRATGSYSEPEVGLEEARFDFREARLSGQIRRHYFPIARHPAGFNPDLSFYLRPAALRSFTHWREFGQLGNGARPREFAAIAETVECNPTRQQCHNVAAIAAHEGNPDIAIGLVSG
jgi:hypothetical protein